jgi:hypothetical protein
MSIDLSSSFDELEDIDTIEENKIESSNSEQ